MIKDKSGRPYCVYFSEKPKERKVQLLLEISDITARLRFNKLPATTVAMLKEQCRERIEEVKKIEEDEKKEKEKKENKKDNVLNVIRNKFKG
jgi:hypothetical protein